ASLVRPGILAMNGQEFDLGRYRNAPTFPAAQRDAEPRVPTKRDAERALRDAGFSRDVIKRALSEGFAQPRDAATEPDVMRLFLDVQKTLATYRPQGV